MGRFFHEFVPKNPAKFDFFFHDLSEALLKGVPFSGFGYMKGQGFHQLKGMKGQGNLSVQSVKKKPKGLTDAFYGCKNVKKNVLLLWILKYFITVQLHRSKGYKVLNYVCARGTICQQKVYERGTQPPSPRGKILWVIHGQIGHFRVPPGLRIKMRLSAQPLI